MIFVSVYLKLSLVSLLAQGAMDCGLELWSGKIGICCISAKNTDLRSKIKDWFTQKQDNVFVNRDMSILVSWRCMGEQAHHYNTDVVAYKNYSRCTNNNIFIESFYWSILILCIHMFILNSSHENKPTDAP
jgi:hypothetical protein